LADFACVVDEEVECCERSAGEFVATARGSGRRGETKDPHIGSLRRRERAVDEAGIELVAWNPRVLLLCNLPADGQPMRDRNGAARLSKVADSGTANHGIVQLGLTAEQIVFAVPQIIRSDGVGLWNRPEIWT